MRIGNIVKVMDFSYSMEIGSNGATNSYRGHTLVNEWRIIAKGKFPYETDNTSFLILDLGKFEVNDVVIQNVYTPMAIFYTQKRFLKQL